MYAIVEDSGTQLKVEEGDVLRIDPRAEAGDAGEIAFDKVLLIGEEGGEARIGAPYLDGASVKAEVLDAEAKGEKIDVIKFKRRKGYRRKQGHRQSYMQVRVTSISG